MPRDSNRYKVVINHEEQYSILPSDRPVPRGWRTVGKEGSRHEVLTYIEEVWTDMRPPSVRSTVEKLERQLLGSSRR